MSDQPRAPNDTDISLHGCVESLALSERASCLSSGRGDVITRKTNRENDGASALPILMCCTANLCNYIHQIDLPHVAIDVFTVNESDNGKDRSYSNTLDRIDTQLTRHPIISTNIGFSVHVHLLCTPDDLPPLIPNVCYVFRI